MIQKNKSFILILNFIKINYFRCNSHRIAFFRMIIKLFEQSNKTAIRSKIESFQFNSKMLTRKLRLEKLKFLKFKKDSSFSLHTSVQEDNMKA